MNFSFRYLYTFEQKRNEKKKNIKKGIVSFYIKITELES